jgi:hypothetical protein
MAIGSFLGNVGNKLLGGEAGGWAQLIGQGVDVFEADANARQADAERQVALANQAKYLQYMMETDSQNRADYLALRDRLLQESSNLGAAMQQAYAYLGTPYTVNPSQIQKDYLTLREQNFGDINKAVNLVSSRTWAGNIAKGMGESTLNNDQQAEIVAKFAPEFMKADQAAYDQAIQRSSSMQDTIQKGRSNLLNEMGTVYGTQFNAERNLLPQQNSALAQSVNQGYADLSKSYTTASTDANKYAGWTTASLDEKIGSILRQMGTASGATK